VTSEQRRWVLGGGLASGKSAVRELLALEGVLTIDSDSVGHDVLLSNGPAFADVSARWPEAVVAGEIDRSALAAIVFADRAELTTLEAITHPLIVEEIEARASDVDGVVVVEVPLIRLGLGAEWRWMVVDSTDEERLQRAMNRGLTERDARARLDAQPSRGEWLARADLVVPNHGSVEDLASTTRALVPNL